MIDSLSSAPLPLPPIGAGLDFTGGFVEIPPEGQVVHLKGYGFIKVFRTVSQNGDEQYWASDLQMDEERGELENQGWGIEVYHRVIKQCCGIERALSAEGSGAEEPLSLCPAGISAFGDAQVANGSLV
jgi:hypothetical protein